MDKDTEEFEAQSSVSADIIRGHINTIILRSLYDRDKYGYEIIEEINEKSHGQYTLKQPTLYSALKRLENQGYIQAYWKYNDVSAGGRRKYYRLTDSGREIAEHNQAEWEYSRTVIDSLISDRNFDFSQPAPSAVDFKLLKQATTRVPTGGSENGEEDKKQPEEKQETSNPPALETRTYTVTGQTETVYVDDPEKSAKADTEEKTEKNEPEVISDSTTEKSLGYSEGVFSSETEKGTEVADDAAGEPGKSTESTESVDKSETVYEVAKTDETSAATSTETADAPADTPKAESSATYASESTYTETEATERTVKNDYTSQLHTTEEEEARRVAHENYLRLIGEGAPRDEAPEPAEETAHIYTDRPEPERDYKNLIDRLYENALKSTEPVAPPPVQPSPEPPVQTERVTSAEPVAAVRTTVYSYDDASAKAASDGLKITTSDEAFAAGSARQTTYDKGATLFKCSLIVWVIMLLEFTLTLLFRQDLHISVAYPIVILAIGCSVALVCGILYGARYGHHMRKPTNLRYILTSVICTVILICIIILFAIVLQVDWSSTIDVMAKVVIPCIVALNIPVFTLSFYLFTK